MIANPFADLVPQLHALEVALRNQLQAARVALRDQATSAAAAPAVVADPGAADRVQTFWKKVKGKRFAYVRHPQHGHLISDRHVLRDHFVILHARLMDDKAGDVYADAARHTRGVFRLRLPLRMAAGIALLHCLGGLHEYYGAFWLVRSEG